MELDSEIARNMGRLQNKRLTAAERDAIHKRLSQLARAKAKIVSDYGSQADAVDDEETFAEQAQIVGGYSP